MLCHVKGHMVSCLSVGSHGRAEANFKVVLQAAVAGAAEGFVCLGNETFHVHALRCAFPALSEPVLFQHSLWAVGWQLMALSFWSQSSEYIFKVLLYLSRWHRHSHCFFWVSSCPLFRVAGELQEVWHGNAYKAGEISSSNKAAPIPAPSWPCWDALCPWCGSSSVLSFVISQWAAMLVLSCITQELQNHHSCNDVAKQDPLYVLRMSRI